jgi:hypothetical protein
MLRKNNTYPGPKETPLYYLTNFNFIFQSGTVFSGYTIILLTKYPEILFNFTSN